MRVVSITGNIAPQTVLNPDRFLPVAGEPPGHTRELRSSDLVVIILYEVPEIPAAAS